MMINLSYMHAGARRFLLALLSLFVGLMALSGGIGVSSAHALITIPVTTCDEAHLKTAVTSAASGSTLAFGCSGIITLTSPVVISKNLTLDGTNQNVTLDGSDAVRVLQVNSGVQLTLNQITLVHGRTALQGGAILNLGAVTINDSTFANNSAGDGGAIFNIGTVTITNSTFANNSNTGRGGAIDNGGTVSITNSTFANNSSRGVGGAIYNNRTVSIAYSTFADNSASFSGAGGAIFNNGSAAIGASIVANNTPSQSNCAGKTLTDQGYNLEGGSNCGFTLGTDLQNTDPNLNPLQNNGGPTQTMALMVNSPAIGQIPAASCLVETDQRGIARPQLDSCDIGAFELQAPLAISVQPNPVHLTGNKPIFSVTITGAVAGDSIQYLDSLNRSNGGLCTDGSNGHLFTADASGNVTFTPTITGPCRPRAYTVVAIDGPTVVTAVYVVLS